MKILGLILLIFNLNLGISAKYVEGFIKTHLVKFTKIDNWRSNFTLSRSRTGFSSAVFASCPKKEDTSTSSSMTTKSGTFSFCCIMTSLTSGILSTKARNLAAKKCRFCRRSTTKSSPSQQSLLISLNLGAL